MTEMQISYRNLQEQIRHNLATEGQAAAQLQETQRHNVQQEEAAFQQNAINDSHYRRSDSINQSHYERQDAINASHYANQDFENNRHNQWNERETQRHNEAMEQQAQMDWYEDKRHNQATESTIPSEIAYTEARTDVTQSDAKTRLVSNVVDIIDTASSAFNNVARGVGSLVTGGANLIKTIPVLNKIIK